MADQPAAAPADSSRPADERTFDDDLDSFIHGEPEPTPDPDPAPEPAAEEASQDVDDAAEPEGDPTPDPEDDAPAGDKPAAATPEATDDDALWEGLSEKQRAALDKLQTSNKRLEGRVPGLQRNLSAMEREIEALRQSRTAPNPDQAKAQQDQEVNALYEAEDFKSLEDEYPEVAKAIRAVIERQEGRFNELLERRTAEIAPRIERLEGDRANSVYDRNAEAVDDAQPAWFEDITVPDPERPGNVMRNPAFAEWLETQPGYVRAAVKANESEVVDPNSVADVVARYRMSEGYQPTDAARTALEASGGSDATQARPNGRSRPDNAAIADRRQRQLRDGQHLESSRTGAPVSRQVPQDYDGALDHFIASGAKRAQG